MLYQNLLQKMLAIACVSLLCAAEGLAPADRTFTVDAAAKGKAMGNKVSNVNIWSVGIVPHKFEYVPEYDISRFVEYVQIMQATGGNAERDLFVNPLDRTTLTDYKFDALLAKCHAILAFGAKPHLKTGNVPLKLTTEPKIGGFHVNVYPPDNYQDYYRYMHAVGEALVKEFGRDELKSWRFGVLTEFENASWFQARDGKAASSFAEYCKLYDCTVAALQDAISPDICIGVHAMAVTEGLWDEREFIRRCGPNGMNTWTGRKGVKLDFVNASFYDPTQGKYTKGKPLANMIDELRVIAESVGLKNLRYGVDEGRILWGTKGKKAVDLEMRITGDTWQAGYDARLFRICYDHDIEYFSSWGFFSTGLCCPPGALPSVSYHVADGVSRFKNAVRLSVAASGRELPADLEIECVAGWDAGANKLTVMLYQFKNDPKYDVPAAVDLKLEHLPFKGPVEVTQKNVDDSCNFFPQWRRDRETYKIGDDCFWWSPDDPSVDKMHTLVDAEARKIYKEKLKSGYASLARMKSRKHVMAVNGGTAELRLEIAPNGVVFLELGE